MRTTRQLSITLPVEMAAEVKAKVESGAYASESEVIRDGLRALEARDAAFEQWLNTDVARSYDALKADPSRSRPLAEVREMIDVRHRKSAKRRTG